MNVAHSLWASVQGDPVFMRRVNGWLTVFWLIFIPISNFTGWVESSAFISNLSLVALVLGNLSAWQASRVEVKQDEQEGNNVSTPMYDLPEHFPIGIDKDGNGPATSDSTVRIVCWCSEQGCQRHLEYINT